MLPPMFAAIGSSLLSAGANLFAKSEMEKKQEEAKKKSIELLNRNRLSEEQINTRVNQVGNAYNTQTMEVLNNQAYGIGNLLNQDLARTLTATKLAPQKAMAEVQTRENLYGINNQINSQIAQIEGQVSTAPTTGEIIGNAINTGMQAYSTFQGMKNQQKYIDAIKELNGITDFNFDMPENPNMLTKPIVDKINLTPNIPRDFQNVSNKIGNFSFANTVSTIPPQSNLTNIDTKLTIPELNNTQKYFDNVKNTEYGNVNINEIAFSNSPKKLTNLINDFVSNYYDNKLINTAQKLEIPNLLEGVQEKIYTLPEISEANRNINYQEENPLFNNQQEEFNPYTPQLNTQGYEKEYKLPNKQTYPLFEDPVLNNFLRYNLGKEFEQNRINFEQEQLLKEQQQLPKEKRKKIYNQNMINNNLDWNFFDYNSLGKPNPDDYERNKYYDIEENDSIFSEQQKKEIIRNKHKPAFLLKMNEWSAPDKEGLQYKKRFNPINGNFPLFYYGGR